MVPALCAGVVLESGVKVLFAVRCGAEDWQEELITEVEERIPAATLWAEANGFNRLRVATLEDGPPDFAATVRA